MKHKLFLVGAAALLLGSCSEELENSVAKNGKTIDFAVSHSGTRVAESTVMADVAGGFKLYAVQDDAPVAGLDGITVEFTGGAWGYGEPVPWPNESAIDFYAYAPATSTNVAAGTGTELVYTVPAPDAQEDFLIANKNASVADGVVQLQFDHALARIEVKAKYTDGGGTKVISAIKLLNLQNKGTIDLDYTSPYTYADDGLTYNTWPIAAGSALTDYDAVLDDEDAADDGVQVTGTGYVGVATGANGLVVLPQATTLGGFNATDDGIAAGKETAFYLVVTIDGADRYYTIADKYKTTEGIIFEAGRKYTLRLNLDAAPVPLGDVEFTAGLNGYNVPAATDLNNDDSAVIATGPSLPPGPSDVEDPDAVTFGGVTWASRNVAAPGTFAESPWFRGYLYQWGVSIGWPGTADINGTVFASDGTTNTWTAVPNGLATDEWGTGTANSIGTDPCPTGWRLPTSAEFQSLLDNAGVTKEWVTDYESSGQRGYKLTDGTNTLFFPATGRRTNTTGVWNSFASPYWSSTGTDVSQAAYLFITTAPAISLGTTGDRSHGCHIRCVKK